MASQTSNHTETIKIKHTEFSPTPEERQGASFVNKWATPKSNANHHVNGVAKLDIDTKIVLNALKSTEAGEGPLPEEDKDKGTGIHHPADQTPPRHTVLTPRVTNKITRVEGLAKQLRLKN